MKRFVKRRTRRGSKKRRVTSSGSSLRTLNAGIQRAISERRHLNTQGAVISTTATNAPTPILMSIPFAYFSNSDMGSILDDTGVGGTALGSSTATNGRFSLYGLSATHTFRNTALNPVFLDVWIMTPTSRVSYRSTTDLTYDTLTEQLYKDIYTGWQAKYLASDISSQVKTSNSITDWTGVGPAYTSSLNFIPSTSNDFKARWRCLKHHAVMMNPGQSFVFTDKVRDLKSWLPSSDFTNNCLGRPGIARLLLVRQRGGLGFSGNTQGYCVTNLVYQVHVRSKVCNELPSQSYVIATSAPTLPVTTSAVSGVGDDSIVV